MKSLSKADEARRAELIANFELADVAIDKVLVEINNLIDEQLNPAIDRYNELVVEATAFRDDVVAAIDEYIGERSDKWLESDKGQAYASWKSEWESFDTSELETVEALQSPDTEHGQNLDGLPPEPAET